MSCQHGKNIKHQRCYACEDIAEAEMKVGERMAKQVQRPQPKKEAPAEQNGFLITVDLKKLVDAMDFSEEEIHGALLNQSKLFLEASYYRVEKMKVRMKAEADMNQKQTEVSTQVRAQTEVKITENYVSEQTALHQDVIAAKQVYDKARTLEEFAKLLMGSFEMRGSMLKACVQLYGAQMAKESGLFQAELDRMGTDKLKEKVRSRFPSQQDEGA